MKILITGVGGYIGSIAAYQFLNAGYNIVGIDNFSTGFKNPIELLQNKFGKDKLKFYETDLRDDLTSIFNRHSDIRAVVHYASSCVVDESMENPEKYFSNNVCGANNLFDHIVRAQIDNLIFSSTCAVYGHAEYSPIDEVHPIHPLNPYGESKLMIERIIRWYAETKRLNYVILRYFNVAGSLIDNGFLLGYSKEPATHLIENLIRSELGIEPFKLTSPKVETPDETPIRDFVNVLDLNKAHIKAVELLLGTRTRKHENAETQKHGNTKALKHEVEGTIREIINLGTGTGYSVKDVIEAVEEVLGTKIKYAQGKARRGESPVLVADNRKAKEILDWQPERTLKQSIKTTYEWFKDHPHGWKN